MSLINEALKRAEIDKTRNASPYFNNLTVLTPAEDDVPPPPRPVIDLPRPKRRTSTMGLLGGVLVLVGLVGTGFVWYRWPSGAPPKRVRAANRAPAAPAALPAAAPGRSEPAALNAKARQASTQTLAKLRSLDSTGEPPESETGSQPAPTSRPVEPGQAPASDPRPTTKPAGAVASTSVRAAKPAAAPPAPTKAPAPPPVDPSRFRLNAIVRGPDGNAALINGKLLHEGQTVLGATIRKIGRYHVDLELSGRRFTIRM